MFKVSIKDFLVIFLFRITRNLHNTKSSSWSHRFYYKWSATGRFQISVFVLKYQVKHHIEGGNYFLVWPKNSASTVEEYLKKEGILIRNMSNKNLIKSL